MGLRQPGQILDARYRLVRPLAQGGMGSVWRAEHLSLRSSVALKVIESATDPDRAATERFLREARLAAALRSPHVVQIFDYGVDGPTPYIVMELLEGESLAERLERVGRLSPAETARVIQHVARAIGRAHEAGIIHRDLKPENVFIVRNDDDEICKVLDFGIAKAYSQELSGAFAAATRTGSLLGTPSYMSPEQAEGNKADPRTDIWALGIIAYRCLLGHLPFSEITLPQLILSICTRPLPVPSLRGTAPEGFDAWFARACARSPADRFESARQASAELSAVLGVESILSEDTPAPAAPLEPTGPAPTTGQFANSEVASSRERGPSKKRALVPLSIATALLLGGLAVSRVTDTLQRPRPPAASAAEPAQATLALTPRPEQGRPAAEQPAAVPAAAMPAAAVPSTPSPAAVLQDATPASERAKPSDWPSGVRLSPGVQVVPLLPRVARENTEVALPTTPAPTSHGGPKSDTSETAPARTKKLAHPRR